ncbi:hypothetical protein Tco_0781528 [Tanacetum coccineum]
MDGLRSGRFRGKMPVVEENTIDEEINVHEEDSDDDFVTPVSYPSKQVTGRNGERKSNRRKENDVLKVFIPVSNGGYQFVEVFNLKTNNVCILEYKKEDKAETKKNTKPSKKGGGIENDMLSTILHADFGRYLTTVGHTHASEIFTARLNFMRLNCQSKSKAANWGVYAMRHMETYMRNMKEKCECGLDVDGRKHTCQINKLRVKYAVKIRYLVATYIIRRSVTYLMGSKDN